MPQAARRGDNAGGPIAGPCSPNVFINGRNASILGDNVTPHGPYPKPDSNIVHQTALTIVSGSGSVFINGKPVVRIGDSVACGHSVSSGSSDVIVG